MKERLIKDDIISEVSSDTGISKGTVEIILNSTIDNIILALSQGKEVQFAGFGTFELKLRAPRTGRNPHTNEPVPIPSRIIPSFKPGKLLKSAAMKERK